MVRRETTHLKVRRGKGDKKSRKKEAIAKNCTVLR
jgi:hypothetical protein